MSFLEIFEPGLKHLREERERQKMLVVRPSHGWGAPMGIDLDAGKATISTAVLQHTSDEHDAGTHSAAVPPSAGQVSWSLRSPKVESCPYVSTLKLSARSHAERGGSCRLLAAHPAS
jgi:Family of unknown function (DUF6191)